MPTMVRETWTDERLDDLSKRVDDGFREVKEEQRLLRTELKAEMAKQHGELKAEMAALRSELKDEMGELRAGLAQLNRRFDALLLTLLAGFVASVLVQFLG